MSHNLFKPIALLCSLVFIATLILSRTGYAQDELPFNPDDIEADAIGLIDDDTPFVEIPFTVRRTGSTVKLDIAPLTDDLDTLLYLVDSQGSIVAENDDRPDGEYGDYSSLIEYPQAVAGQYRVIATRYGLADGRTSGYFRLLIDIEEPKTPLENITYRVRPGELRDAGYPELETKPEAKLTILAYYGGDTNLEGGILNDLKEFELGGGSDDIVRVIAMVDRHPEFTRASGNWLSTRIFEVSTDVSGKYDENGDINLDTVEIVDLGDLDTSNGETFAQFLVWGLRTYPAENYIIALGGHGASWHGIVTDDSAATVFGVEENEAILTLPEIDKALRLAQEAANIDKFDMLINDACLMSSIEYYAVISQYFDYSLASPEIIVNPAHDMALLLELVRSNPSQLNFTNIGERLIEQYMTQDILQRVSSDVVYLSSALTNLNRFDDVIEAVENFASVVNADPNVRALELGEARANTYTYTHFLGGQTKVDLGNLMTRIIANSNDQDLIDAATLVNRALRRAVIYGDSGERVRNITSYYNIYFPDYSEDFDIAYFDETPLKEWSRLLRNYYNSFTPQVWLGAGEEIPFHPPTSPHVDITQTHPTQLPVSILNPAVLSVEVVGRNIAYGDITVDKIQPDGSLVRLSTERLLTDVVVDGDIQQINQWNTGVNQLFLNWDGTLPVVSDGTRSNNELLVITENVAFLEGRYQEPDSSTWYDVGVAFDVQNGIVQRIINRSEVTGALAVIDIAPGSTFQAYRATVSRDGDVDFEPGNTYTWPEDGLTWRWDVAPSGEYRMGTLVAAFGGKTGYDATTILVDNDELPIAFRADTRVDLGFTLVRPEDWQRLADLGLRFITQNDARTARKIVYLIPTAPPNGTLQQVAAAGVNFFQFTPIGDYQEITVDGLPALQFDYEFEDENGITWRGRGFATYVDNFYPVIFGAEVASEFLNEDANALARYYDNLANRTLLFDAYGLQTTDTAQWISDVFLDERAFSIPKTWFGNDDDYGEWLRYASQPYPQDEDLTQPFIAIAKFDAQSQAQGNRSALNNVITGYATDDVQRLVITGNNTYFGQYHTWEATLYEAIRDGIPVTGRVYVTTTNDLAYAIWVETPVGEEFDVFATIFEPFVDSFRISPIAMPA